MDLYNKVKRLIFELGALPFLILIILVALLIVIVFAVFDLVESKALIGFLGVIIGSGLAAATSLLLAKENRQGQLAIASLDKRLEAHQTAYAIWHEIRGAIHRPERLDDVLMKADQFWKNNCLYLDPLSRKAFRDCIIFASSHKDLLYGPRTEEMRELIKESWGIITKPGDLLVQGVALPSLGEKEYAKDEEIA